MNIVNLKKNIYDKEKIPDILIALGCHDVKYEQSGTIITAGLPDGDNRRSVQVKNNTYLDSCIRTKGIVGIDIFDIVSYIKFNELTKDDMKYSRSMSVNWVKRTLDMRIDDYSNFEWAKQIHSKKKDKPLKENILMQFLQFPSKIWIEEGIGYATQEFFGIAYSLENNQIIIPIRNKDDELIGVKARNLDIDKSSDNKYIYLYPCSASSNLYGLNISKKYIKEENRIILFESEKSVMKAFQYGLRDTVALGCKDITISQLNLIKEYMNEDTKIILAFDKDVYFENGVYNFEHFREINKKFKGHEVFAIVDKDNLTGEKDAPVDKGEKVFNLLLDGSILVKDLVDTSTNKDNREEDYEW